MVLLWPWSLVGFGAVAIAALWALRRPRQEMAIVGSVELWTRAKEALSKAAKRKAKRMTLSWLLLLAGAVACVAAMTRPAVNAPRQIRHVGLVVLPSAELGTDRGITAMRLAAIGLLDRLDSHDKVTMVFPRESGVTPKGVSRDGWLTVGAAHTAVAQITALPIPVADLAPVSVPSEVDHVYTLVAAGTDRQSAPGLDIIEIPHGLDGVTVEAIGAEETTPGRAEIFIALRNHRGQLWLGQLRCRGLDATGKEQWQWERDTGMSISEGQREEALMDIASSEILVVEAVPDSSQPATAGCGAYLVRRPTRRTKVAVAGKVNEILTRFILADDTLELVDAEDPDVQVLIANGVDPPRDKAAIVIAPPTPPKGWRIGEETRDVDLSGFNVKTADPVMRDVSFDKIHVARVRRWLWGNSPLVDVLAADDDGGAIVMRQDRTAQGIEKRVYVAFDLSLENTAFGTTDMYVTLMANAMRYLVPRATGKRTFAYLSPVEAGPAGERTLLAPATDEALATGVGRGYPWPGAYRLGKAEDAGEDEDVTVHAVNLTGLVPAVVKVAPTAAVSQVGLPVPRRETTGMEIWPALLAMAVLLWLGGWCVRLN